MANGCPCHSHAACGSCVLKLTPFRSAANAAHQSSAGWGHDDELAEILQPQLAARCGLQVAGCKLQDELQQPQQK